jgi:hypothetical protein
MFAHTGDRIPNLYAARLGQNPLLVAPTTASFASSAATGLVATSGSYRELAAPSWLDASLPAPNQAPGGRTPNWASFSNASPAPNRAGANTLPSGQHGKAAGWQSLLSDGFSRQQIKNILEKHGGTWALEAMRTNLGQLTGLGFDVEQIAKITNNHGGARAIQAVLDHFKTLEASGFSIDQITEIASRGGGQAIRAVVEHFDTLHAKGYSTQEITDIAGKGGGREKIEALVSRL